jgi:NTE family protein
MLYDTARKSFTLQLTRRPQQNFQVGFGGVIATRDISNVFLGLNFYEFNRILTHASVGFQTGNFYKSALMKVRMDFPYQFYVEPHVSFDSWNYLDNDDLLNEVSGPSAPTVLKRWNRKYGISLGVPIHNAFKGVLAFESINTTDTYINGDVFISTDKLDALNLRGIKTGLHLSSNNLNRRQYPSQGRLFSFNADFFSIQEEFFPGSTSIRTTPSSDYHKWVRLRLSAEQYFGNGWYRPGYVAEAVGSNQPYFQNYFGTIINAPAFMPIQDSRTLILQNFRAFNYAAVGVKNIFMIRNKFEARADAFLFKPIQAIVEDTEQHAAESSDKSLLFFAGTIGLVYHSPIGPVSFSTNYYDDDENRFGFLLHVGFLLFNKHSFE